VSTIHWALEPIASGLERSRFITMHSMTHLSTCGQQLDPHKARSGDPARQFCSPLFDVHQWAPYQIMAVHDVPYFPLYNVVRPFPVQLRLCLTTAANDQCVVCRHICWGPHGPTDSAKYMSRHPRTARNGWRHPSFAVEWIEASVLRCAKAVDERTSVLARVPLSYPGA
jgi:hypothetical protein